jgi:translation initiation factor 2A
MASPLQFAYRTQKTIGLFDADPVYQSLPGFTKPEGNLRCCDYSPCGRFFGWASTEDVTVVDASTGGEVMRLPILNVYEIGFSPRGSFIITWQRPSKDENGDATKNLKVWRTAEDGVAGAEKQPIGSFVQKQQGNWNLQYTADEKYCARLVTNEVQFHESHDLITVWNKLRVEGAASYALAPGLQNHAVAVFVPERKGQPAAVKVFNVPTFNSPISQKTFFKGDKVQLKWNKQGSSLLVLAQTDVDRSGKSYYGETTLYLLSTSGAFDARVTLDKEGPIHDVSWSPNSREFGVVYGYMPAKATIFNHRAIAQHTFPLGPRNTINFSPNSRFVLVAGFGNLAGQVDIYDMQKDYRKVCALRRPRSLPMAAMVITAALKDETMDATSAASHETTWVAATEATPVRLRHPTSAATTITTVRTKEVLRTRMPRRSVAFKRRFVPSRILRCATPVGRNWKIHSLRRSTPSRPSSRPQW